MIRSAYRTAARMFTRTRDCLKNTETYQTFSEYFGHPVVRETYKYAAKMMLVTGGLLTGGFAAFFGYCAPSTAQGAAYGALLGVGSTAVLTLVLTPFVDETASYRKDLSDIYIPPICPPAPKPRDRSRRYDF